jgi:putative mRNA 3-end processing factor
MATRKSKARARSFLFRGGTRIAGTVISCDAQGGGDLLFLSNALAHSRAVPGRGRGRGGRAQILTTVETLALLGRDGDSLRSRALIVVLGRPFTLGTLRLELLSSGHLPGAATLSCEGGDRRILYAGAARLGTPARGAAPAAVRATDALCIDATFGHPRFVFISREEAEAEACAFVRAARDAGRAPVLLVSPFGPAQDLAPALVAQGWKLRGHRSMVAAAGAYRRAGVMAPTMARFAGTLRADEVLLWPAVDRAVGLLGRLGPVRVAWVSGWATDAHAAARLGVDRAIPYSSHADFAGVLAYVAATGAREVAVTHGFTDDLASSLRDREIDAYALGPPRQIQLFGGGLRVRGSESIPPTDKLRFSEETS